MNINYRQKEEKCTEEAYDDYISTGQPEIPRFFIESIRDDATNRVAQYSSNEDTCREQSGMDEVQV